MIYRFANHVLDTDRCELRRDDDVIALEAQVYAILAALIENRERILSKEELIGIVWSGRAVSDSAIASRIHAARAAVGDDGQKQAVIKTFSGRGYRFVAQAEGRANEPNRTAEFEATALSVDVSRPVPGFQGWPAIVVLPFDIVSGDENDIYIAGGLAEEVSTRIALWRTFPVIARQSALALKHRHLSATEIGRHLGVRYVVEGSFRRSGSRLRVGTRLIGADTGHQLWADRFESGLEDVFALQDEVADKIAAALEPELTAIEIAPYLGAQPGSLDAWQAHLRGLWHFYRSNQDDNASAIRWFQSAIDRDPLYGPAFGGLSMAYVFRHGAGWVKDQGAAVDTMSLTGEKSIVLAPSDPRGHVGYGWSKLCQGDFDAALRSIEAAVACNPSSAFAWYYFACALCFACEPEDALTKAEKALRLSPRDPLLVRMWAIKARCNYALGDYEKAIEIFRAVTTNSAVVHPLGHRDLAASLVALGRVSEARKEIERLIKLSPGYSLERAESTFPWKSSDQQSLYLDRLRQAGLE